MTMIERVAAVRIAMLRALGPAAVAMTDAVDTASGHMLNDIQREVLPPRILAALNAAGWAVVPKVATEEMVLAGPIHCAAAAIKEVKIEGQSLRLTDAYAWALANAAVNAYLDWLIEPYIPASGPQTARLCAKPDFGRKIGPKRKPRA